MSRVFAWLGGALFVTSLATLVYFYAVTLARPSAMVEADPSTLLATGSATSLSAGRATLVNVALFTVFAVHHSMMARAGAKRWIARRIPHQLERSVYVWIASILAIVMCLLWQPIPGILYSVEGPGRWFLHGLQVMGLVLIVRAAGVIDPLELAGIRQVVPSRGDDGGDGSTLKIVGPFRWIRHPTYLGWILLVFGAPLMTMGRALFATVSSLYLIVAIPWEEKSLVATFGDRYRGYQAEVRWRLLPWIW